MTTIDLTTEHPTIEEILRLAEGDPLVVRTAEGKVFAVSELEATAGEEDEDFSREVALARQNAGLRALLAERSLEPATYTIDEVRERLGLSTPDPTGHTD